LIFNPEFIFGSPAKVNSRNEKSPAKFARLKEGITKLAGEKTHRQPE